MGRIQKYSMINCAVNPQCARERAFAYNPVFRKKKVVIVGGGCSMLLMAPLFAASMTEPATLASFFGGLVLCYALVSIGAFASNHVAASLNLTDYRTDD